MIKKIKKIFVLFLILILVLIIYLILIHYNGRVDNRNVLSRDEVITLLEKGKKYPNYYYSGTEKIFFLRLEKDFETENFIKDNILKTTNNGKLLSYYNFNTGYSVKIMQQNNVAIISNNSFEENNKYSQNGIDYSLIANQDKFNYDFEYIGKIYLNERPTEIVKIWNSNQSKLEYFKFYIDEESGLIVKRINYTNLGLIKVIININIKFDVVTNDDISKPDLSCYNLLNY